MNTIVNFKIAELLKKAGYDNVTDLIYMTNHTEEVLFENINGLKHSDGNNPFCSAPTIAEVVMWLYEKHDRWIYVNYDHGLFHCFMQSTFYKDLDEEDSRFHNLFNYKTPAEAYLVAIEYVLKNLPS